ncbi:PAS domain S-box protein [Baekduia sp.]|jgi:PAS domain S-box-containing protein|uniref:sensor histidine kinase n=1 Tax=Baekduia sp. TaxID=2600305 RepID=UPI002E034CBD|nr:PAS domain S-box protein [Baekduia sp.]
MSGIEERHAQRLFTLSRDLLIVVDPDRRIVSVNPSWERVLGYRSEQLIGRVVSELLHPGDTDCTAKAIEAIADQDPSAQVENRYRHADGHWVWLRWTTARDERDGYFYGVARDVTAQHQDLTELRESERRLAEAERLAGLGSFEWRLSDSSLTWSLGTYRLFGIDPSEPPINDERFWALMTPAEAEHAGAVLGRAAEDLEPWELEYSIPGPEGGRRRVLLSHGEAYQDGGEDHIRGTIQDVTQERLITRQQQAIARLGQLALAGSDLQHLFDDVCRVAVDLLGTDMATILALEDDGSMTFAASLGFGEVSGTALPPAADSIVHHALTAHGPLVVADWLQETRFPYSAPLREAGVRCSVVLPIRGREGPFGVLTTHALAPGVAALDQRVAFLDALASFLATAIDRLHHEAEIEALATLRGRLVAENLEAEERVRQRISEALHDGALQDLLAARQDLVEAAATSEDTAREEMLSYAREGVERAVALLREAVHALHPVVLQHGGLEAAMQAAADQAARQGNFRAEVTVDATATGLRDELVMSLARELLTNCAKHAQAHIVRVRVAGENGDVLLEVADDGRGIDAADVAAAPLHGHIGLASLTQRVEAVGGSLDLGSAPGGGGTTVVVRLPID